MHDKIKDFKCTKCEYTCSFNGALKNHIKRKHDKIKDCICQKCGYACSSNGDLRDHIKSVHERPIMDKRMSLGEYAIFNYLTKNHISFEKEKSFFDLLSPKNQRLRYDFYIQSHNFIVGI